MIDPTQFHLDHLPKYLQDVVRPFKRQAEILVATQPESAERDAAVKQIEAAKDAAVLVAVRP